MKRILTILALLSTTCLAAENPISSDILTSWLNFDKPVTLERTELKTMEMQDWGKLVWCYGYSSKTQTLSSYRIALYQGGTLFGDRRLEMETRLEEGIEKLRTLDPGREEPDMAIETRPDGRKVFFSLAGFGPGGAAYAAYTTFSTNTYDLLVMRIVDFEDDMPQEKRLKNPAKPTKTLREVFGLIEDEILKRISQPAGGAYVAPAAGATSAHP